MCYDQKTGLVDNNKNSGVRGKRRSGDTRSCLMRDAMRDWSVGNQQRLGKHLKKRLIQIGFRHHDFCRTNQLPSATTTTSSNIPCLPCRAYSPRRLLLFFYP